MNPFKPSGRSRDRAYVAFQEALSRWGKIKPVAIAKAVYACVKGRGDKLVGKPGNSSSIWGRIVKEMGLENQKIDRLWASAAYHSNKRGVKVIHEQLCTQVRQKYIGLIDPQDTQLYCLCRNPESNDDDEVYPMVECDTCKEWYHWICVGLRTAPPDDDIYECPKCDGVEPKEMAPPIFLPLQINATGKERRSKSIGSSTSTPSGNFRQAVTPSSSEPLMRSVILDDTPKQGQGKEKPRTGQSVIPSALSDQFASTTSRETPSEVTDTHQTKLNQPLVRSRVTPDELVVEKAAKKFTFRKKQHAAPVSPQQVPDDLPSRADFEKQLADSNQDTISESDDGNDLNQADHEEVEDQLVARRGQEDGSGVEGPIQRFKKFTITVPKEKYKLIEDRIHVPEAVDPRYSYRFNEDIWGNLMYDEFLHQCPAPLKGCNVSFKDHRFPKLKNGRDFCVMRGFCSRTGSVSCGMKYTFYIRDDPIKDTDVPVEVVPKGTLHHDLSNTTKRQLTGKKRQDVKAELKNMSAGVYRRTMYGKDTTDKVALQRQNLTEVQTINVLRVVRHEANTEQDLDKDVFMDLVKRSQQMKTLDHLSGNHVKGFVQTLTLDPFSVSFYSERQLVLLKRYLATHPHGVLHFDATGNITAKLPDWLGEKQSFYYALVLQLPGSVESPCVPVLEFVTNQHSAANSFLISDDFNLKNYNFIDSRSLKK